MHWIPSTTKLVVSSPLLFLQYSLAWSQHCGTEETAPGETRMQEWERKLPKAHREQIKSSRFLPLSFSSVLSSQAPGNSVKAVATARAVSDSSPSKTYPPPHPLCSHQCLAQTWQQASQTENGRCKKPEKYWGGNKSGRAWETNPIKLFINS